MIISEVPVQTIHDAFQEICAGADPWYPLGNFMDDFFSNNYSNRREELLLEPIREPEDASSEIHRWAVFCAASVEYLCQRYSLPCPDWVHDPHYTLADAWYYSIGAHRPKVRERLERETPEPFTKRNIYCGDKIFANKYEEAEEYRARQSA